MQERELSLLLVGPQRGESINHAADLRNNEGAVAKRRLLALRVLEVALDAHGAQQEPANINVGVVRDERMLERAGVSVPRDRGSSPAPVQVGGLSTRRPRGEAETLVLGVSPEVHDALGARVEIDLQRVARGIPEDSGLVSLICDAVVEAALRKGQ